MATSGHELEQTARDARRAAELMADPVLERVFSGLREKYVERSLLAAELDAREAARAIVLALAEVRRELGVIVTDGEYAMAALRQRQ